MNRLKDIDKENISDNELETLMDLFDSLSKNNPEKLRAIFLKNTGINFTKCTQLINLLEDMHINPSNYIDVKSKTKGDVLEEISSNMLIQSKLYSEYRNVSSDSNEYDIIIKPSLLFNKTKDILPGFLYQHIICECKNYSQSINVTWVGKLYSLLEMSAIKLGIIFSYESVSGRHEWDAAKALIKKIYLKKGIAILNINKKDLDDYVNGKGIIDILEEKFESLVYMANIDLYKKKHNSEKKITNEIEGLLKDISTLTKKI